jgi:asparaginyl-tRNA synthetase
MDVSMKRVTIREVLENASSLEGKTIRLAGWVRSKRSSKNVVFVTINDGSTQGELQLVADQPEVMATADSLQTGCSLFCHGKLQASQGKGQAWEFHLEALECIGEAPAATYPLQKKGHTLEFLREVGHLRARTNTFGAVFRVRNTVSRAIHTFFQSRGFVWAQTPILTSSDCEGAGEMFTVTTLDLNKVPKTPTGAVDFGKDFFCRQANLTVSGQLEGEFLACALGKIYTFGPTFRAENSNTTRHLSEFWMVEPEIAFADLSDNMELAEDFIRYVIREVLEAHPEEMAFFEKFYENDTQLLAQISGSPFERMSYTEAIARLQKSGHSFQFAPEWGADIQTEHERYLTEVLVGRPVIVYDYPKDIKSFYMKANEDGKTVAGMDVLVPKIGEIIGGSEREYRYDRLLARMKEMKIPTQDLEWYLDLRRFGTVPHCGFGLGLERMVMYVTGMKNIRDVILCPRAPGTILF